MFHLISELYGVYNSKSSFKFEYHGDQIPLECESIKHSDYLNYPRSVHFSERHTLHITLTRIF